MLSEELEKYKLLNASVEQALVKNSSVEEKLCGDVQNVVLHDDKSNYDSGLDLSGFLQNVSHPSEMEENPMNEEKSSSNNSEVCNSVFKLLVCFVNIALYEYNIYVMY